jgi:putative transposase
MIIHERFNYRVYPNKTTISRLDQWNSALKWLWNLANEQRRNGYSRPAGEKIYPSAFGQGKELTALRKLAPWIEDVPRHVAIKMLDNLDQAWRLCFDKISGTPKWKKKSTYVSFTEFDHLQFSVRGNKLKFPKLAPMKIVMSRPLEGKPKSCTLKRDGDQWFVSIMCEVEISDPEPRHEPKVGIDRGVRNIIADSDRRLVENPKFLDKVLNKLVRAQRTVSRRVKGSKNQAKAKNRVMRINRTVRRQRNHFLHEESTHYAKSHGTVVLEDLNTAGMIKGNCSRQIADSGWGMFAQYLKYKLQWSGGQFLEVPAQYSSQTCAACYHVDRASRSGDKFKCTKCGHEDHADLNAAVIVLNRQSLAIQPVEGSSKRAPRRSRKTKSVKAEMV